VTDADDSLARYRQAIEDLISDGMLYTTIDEFVSNNSARRLEVLLIQSFRRCAARRVRPNDSARFVFLYIPDRLGFDDLCMNRCCRNSIYLLSKLQLDVTSHLQGNYCDRTVQAK
jgi:hypothetical protein